MPAKFELIAPCFFGCESTANFELRRIGAEDIRVSDGRLTFRGGADMIAAANLNLRTVERVMLLLNTYTATTFDELFDGVYSIHWEELLPADAAFPVTGSSLNSQLSSVPACQSIIKKAVVKRLMQGHRTTSLPETGAEYKIRFMLRKNVCEIMLDTTGDGLHKRGYRRNSMEAPIRETLAATIADLGRVRRGRALGQFVLNAGGERHRLLLVEMVRGPGRCQQDDPGHVVEPDQQAHDQGHDVSAATRALLAERPAPACATRAASASVSSASSSCASASGAWFMDRFGVIIDIEMIRNAAETKLGVRVVPVTVEKYLGGEPQQFELCWLDPPYAVPGQTVSSVVDRLAQGWLAPGGIVVVERARRGGEFAWPDRLGDRWQRRYGETTLYFATEGEA